MSEAIIVRGGYGLTSGGNNSDATVLNVYATSTSYYVAPKAGNYWVACIGGGGGGGGPWKSMGGSTGNYYWIYHSGNGGYSGFYNCQKIFLNSGETVEVSIGLGSASGTGGSTFFGTYVSANGGSTDDGGRAGSVGKT